MWLKEAWIEWLGPDRILELYAGTEAQAVTIITGREWLEHRGSVGRPSAGEFMITDLDGNEVPAGVEGEVWLRSGRDEETYRYVGAEARTMPGGWESLGDMGWFDADGYLYLGDRTQDMILSGGANIYPAEVEAAIQEHPAVRSVCVIGLPDEDRGNTVHAIVEADPDALDVERTARLHRRASGPLQGATLGGDRRRPATRRRRQGSARRPARRAVRTKLTSTMWAVPSGCWRPSECPMRGRRCSSTRMNLRPDSTSQVAVYEAQPPG